MTSFSAGKFGFPDRGSYIYHVKLKKIKVMSEQFIKAMSIAVDKKMITPSQAFEIIRETSAIHTEVVKQTIGFKQNN